MFLVNAFNFLSDLFPSLLLPLNWLPEQVYSIVETCLFAFEVVVIGRILKWLWDALPIV